VIVLEPRTDLEAQGAVRAVVGRDHWTNALIDEVHEPDPLLGTDVRTGATTDAQPVLHDVGHVAYPGHRSEILGASNTLGRVGAPTRVLGSTTRRFGVPRVV